MKKHLFSMTALVVSVLCMFAVHSCGSSDPGIVSELYTDVSPEIVYDYQGVGGPKVIGVITNQDAWDYTVSQTGDWFIHSRTGSVLQISLANNNDYPERTAVITITSAAVAPVTVTVRQTGLPKAIVMEGMSEGQAFTVTYTDGTTESMTVSSGMLNFTTASAGKTIYSINSAVTDELYIGRKTGEFIGLKFDGAGLVLRNADVATGMTPIGSVAELNLLRTHFYLEGYNYRQEADLDMLGSANITTAGLTRLNWSPIGAPASGSGLPNNLVGHYDGGNHTISNLYINRTSGTYTGFFAAVSSTGSISNLGIESGSVTMSATTGSYTGALCGSSHGNITNCYNKIDVKGANYVGGIAGQFSGVMLNCYNTGIVEATGSTGYAGGLVAHCSGGSVSNSYNTGNITGRVRPGGVVGNISGGSITNCYNTGNITAHTSATNYAGGVVGYVTGSAISKCYNTGDVTGLATLGGVVGILGSGSTLEECYNTGDIVGTGANIGGGVGSNSGTVTAVYNKGSVTTSTTATNANVAGIAGTSMTGQIVGCYNIGRVNYSGTSNAFGAISGYGTSTYPPVDCFWLDYSADFADNPTAGVGTSSTGTPNNTGAIPFSASNWPSSGLEGWGSSYWSSYGAWVAGGTPAGVNSNFPKLVIE